MPQFTIWIVSPPGYPHSRCFEEIARSMRAAFAALGFDAPIVTDPKLVQDWAIVLGCNLLVALPREIVPKKAILYNLEQVHIGSTWFKPAYLELLRQYPVWDYSPQNIEELRKLGVANIALCGIGYMPILSDFPQVEEDIDVVFVGARNPRRNAVLQQLVGLGVQVKSGFNVYGEQRNAVLARAKLVLNLHLYDAHVFEIVRVSHMLANRKCVVSETGNDKAMEEPLKEGVAFASYEHLAAKCVALLRNPQERKSFADRGFEIFRGMSQVPLLERAMGAMGLI
jgi:hypothetical protein